MNQEEPTLPAYRPTQQISNPNQTAVNADTPMDEFEYTGKGSKAGIKNVLKAVKILAIILIVLMVLGGGAFALQNILKSSQGNTATATATPEATAFATVKPQITYPTEYDEIQKDIAKYDESVNSVSDTRTRIEIPTINFGIAF